MKTPHCKIQLSAKATLRALFVARGYRTAPSFLGQDMKELVGIARSPAWPGYLSAPSRATAARGRRGTEAAGRAAAETMLRILDGADERAIPRYGAIMAESEANVEVDRAAAAHAPNYPFGADVRFNGDRLVLETPPLPSGDRQAVSRLVWERIRP